MKRHLLLPIAGIIGLALGLVSVFPLVHQPASPPVYRAHAAAHFRIIDVRAEYGHLVVEVEHFKPDGAFWFFENYVFQGREGGKYEIAVNALGEKLLSDETVAPKRIVKGPPQREEQYLPSSRTWKYSTTISLEQASILGVIDRIHMQRQPTGWNKGANRLTVAPRAARNRDTDHVQALVTKFSPLVGTAYIRDAQGKVLAHAGWLPRVNPGQGNLEWGTVSTFFPDAGTGATTVDGSVSRSLNGGSGEAWADIRANAGNDVQDISAIALQWGQQTDSASPNFTYITRPIWLFDTGTLPNNDTIDSATLSIFGTSKTDQITTEMVMNIVSSNPATSNDLVAADYGTFGSTKFVDSGITLTNWSITAYNEFTLNLNGRNNISLTGISKFGGRTEHDIDNSSPGGPFTIQADNANGNYADAAGTANDPQLVVTHTTPVTAAITGTMTPVGSEQEIRTGGETIVITLTNGTWNAAGSAFDNQRQAIINGIDSAQSEARGWDTLARGTFPVTNVVRTSSTVVTVTLSASVGYAVTAHETLTVTVPGAAHSGGSNVVATPTFQIQSGLETLTITGTLGGSGGVPSEIRAGGETITYTVSGAAVQASGASFDTTRQGVLDNIDSNLADQNGWDAVRSSLPVTNVVRTSGTVVTVTLSALTAYAIPATETLTATIPASGAVVYSLALAGTPTFNIVPSFVSSGNRVSNAIDLSAITAVAYCAIGWEATTPTGTTVTVETSLNNGTTYSSATNGACPTGITLGGSLSTITSFRIRDNLSTTIAASTPTVESQALIIVDRTGHALHYELNTTPGVTIEDRSSNTNDGTVSYPVPSAVVSSTTGDITTTRTPVSTSLGLAPINVASPVTGVAQQGNLFQQAEEGFADLPFYDVVRAMANAGDTLPIRFLWAMFLGLMIIILGVVTLHLTTSLFAAVVAMGLGIVAAGVIGNGLIPLWVLFPYTAIAGAFLLLRPRIQT